MEHFKTNHPEVLVGDFCRFCGEILKVHIDNHYKTCMQYILKKGTRGKCKICKMKFSDYASHFETYHFKRLLKKPKKNTESLKITLERIGDEEILAYQMPTLPTFSLKDIFGEEENDNGGADILEVNDPDQVMEVPDFDLKIKNVWGLSEYDWLLLSK